MTKTSREICTSTAGLCLTADIAFGNFPHQLETTKYYPGFANGPGNATSSDFYSHNNLNTSPGQDYAIQVQEFKANFKGYLTPDGAIRWKVNVFGIDKEGDRQVNVLTHCYNASITYPGYPMTSNPTVTRQCHILSQPQQIDWQTTQVEPGIEAHLGHLTLEYTHLARQFTEDDQSVTNLYRAVHGLGFPAAAGATFSTAGVAIVPNEIPKWTGLRPLGTWATIRTSIATAITATPRTSLRRPIANTAGPTSGSPTIPSTT